MFNNLISKKAEIVFFLCFFITVSAFVIACSPIVQLIFGHDTPVFLDGAWRLQNNQLPHIDYSSILGYGFICQQYLFLKFFDYDVIAIAVSTVVLTSTLMVLFLAFYKSKTFIANTDTSLRFYIFFLLISVGLGQYCIGYTFLKLTYACIYNRYCAECLLMFVLSLILVNTGKINKKNILLLVVISLLLNYMLFVKITFFIAAVSLLFVFLFLKYISIVRFTYILLLSLVVFFSVLLFSGENFLLILQDYKNISSVRSSVFTTWPYILDKFNHPLDIILILCYSYLIIQLIQKKATYKIHLLLVFMALVSIFIHFTNFGYTDIILLIFIPCLFILPDFVPYRNLLSTKLFMLSCCIFFVKNLYSIALIPVSYNHKHTELQNKYVNNFYIYSIIPKSKIEYSARQEEGVKLINKNIKSGEKIMSYTFENIFSLLTHTVPPKNNLLVWQDQMTYSKNKYPKPDYVFSDVNLLLIPKHDEWEASLIMKKIYAKTVKEKFMKIDESHNWTLYRKK